MLKSIKSELRTIIGSKFDIYNAIPLSGGDINTVMKLSTSEGEFCIKINDAQRYPNMFEREATGLNLLRAHSKFRIPEVIAFGEANAFSFLLLEFIPSGEKAGNFWENFGTFLGEMHQTTRNQFGLDEENYIGSLNQTNTSYDSWAEFYAQERLLPQIELAFKKGLLNTKDIKNADLLVNKLGSYFPEEPPALLHGDLWSGNYMVDALGNPGLIDPAVYFGHREIDLGMSLLFGGFRQDMYTAYNATYPLEPNWKERVELCQLYPVLVHVNLFGGSYVSQARRIIQQYA